MDLFNVVVRYKVYIYDESECITEYAGPDLDIAKEIYIKTRVHADKISGVLDNNITKEITVVLKDVYDNKILFEYNTLQDAC